MLWRGRINGGYEAARERERVCVDDGAVNKFLFVRHFAPRNSFEEKMLRGENLRSWCFLNIFVDDNWSVFVSKIQTIAGWVSAFQFLHAFYMVVPGLLSVEWATANADWSS